jgi:hypothetical protein
LAAPPSCWIAWLSLGAELGRWRRLGRRPRLWWRDDAARAPSAALDRLLEAAAGRPLTLAIVPDGDLAGLAARLGDESALTVSQHGIDHVDRRPGEASEYPAGTTPEAMAAQIEAARARMVGAGLAPSVYTPTWNRIDAALAAAIPLAGFEALSAASAARAAPGLRRLDADLDILRWKGGVRFRGRRPIFRSLARQLRERRRAGDFARPIGLLTHHLAHDEAAWDFLAAFLALADDRFDWTAFGRD